MEPIYAQPNKPGQASSRDTSCSGESSQPNEYDEVQLRHDVKPEHVQVAYENTKDLNARHSDSDIGPNLQHVLSNSQRKYHSKSFSLSENRVAANLNVFQQNRELWEKRIEMQSEHKLTTPRILTRNRIAPDLVMDLPVSSKDRVVTSSHDSLNFSDVEPKPTEDMTSAERFATQSQCTLKKNERFTASAASNIEISESKDHHTDQISEKSKASSKSSSLERPLSEMKAKEANRSSAPHIVESSSSAKEKPNIKSKDAQHKSPVPIRNTHKFISQFDDLKLTGGCLSSAVDPSTDLNQTEQTSSQSTPLSSFKPQVKSKPQLFRKPIGFPPTTPEMLRRNKE